MYQVGVDIVEIDRIRKAVDRFGPKFLRRVYTPAEIDFCRDRTPELAARFAGKEAVMKALGTGRGGVSWQDIEILPNRRKAPLVFLHGGALLRARRMGIDGLGISLSHSRDYAVASVVAETSLATEDFEDD
ncbi:MAG: holo-ACP synthase [Dehalococcoidia bacterium]|nr:holo-ACP synthase [Dehalococcoidia bacterium]